jgi:hypothetical protein
MKRREQPSVIRLVLRCFILIFHSLNVIELVYCRKSDKAIANLSGNF